MYTFYIGLYKFSTEERRLAIGTSVEEVKVEMKEIKDTVQEEAGQTREEIKGAVQEIQGAVSEIKGAMTEIKGVAGMAIGTSDTIQDEMPLLTVAHSPRQEASTDGAATVLVGDMVRDWR